MPSVFSEHQAAMVRGVQAEFGEKVVVTAMTSSQTHAGTPDANNPPQLFNAVCSIEVLPGERVGRRNGEPTAMFQKLDAEIRFDLADFEPGRNFPRKGDVIRLIDRPDAADYVIRSTANNGRGRLVCQCERTGT